MRIITGKHKGRKLEQLQIAEGKEKQKLTTRPTMDRVKESIFNILVYKVQGAKVLDLFAGSGSLGIEALSRGASEATFVDLSKEACDVLKRNLTKLGENQKVLNTDYKTALEAFAASGNKFDIIFLDPPYGSNFGEDAFKKIIQLELLEKDGTVVFESGKKLETAEGFNFREQKYSNKFVYIITGK